LLRDERMDTIVHFAAESHVDRSVRGPDRFVETNSRNAYAVEGGAKCGSKSGPWNDIAFIIARRMRSMVH